MGRYIHVIMEEKVSGCGVKARDQASTRGLNESLRALNARELRAWGFQPNFELGDYPSLSRGLEALKGSFMQEPTPGGWELEDKVDELMVEGLEDSTKMNSRGSRDQTLRLEGWYMN